MRDLSASNVSQVSRKPLQCIHITTPYTGHVVEVTFRNHYNAYDMFSNRTWLSSSLFNRRESNVKFCCSLDAVYFYEWECSVDNYAKDSGPGGLIFVWFYHEPLRVWIKTNINKFAISSHTALKLDKQALKNCFKVTCEFQVHILRNKKVSVAKDYD